MAAVLKVEPLEPTGPLWRYAASLGLAFMSGAERRDQDLVIKRISEELLLAIFDCMLWKVASPARLGLVLTVYQDDNKNIDNLSASQAQVGKNCWPDETLAVCSLSVCVYLSRQTRSLY